jgi:hypothetical protein
MSDRGLLVPDLPITVGRASLVSPSLRGQVTVSTPDELGRGTRGAGVPDAGFANLLLATDVVEQLTVELADVEHLDQGAGGGRGGPDFLQLEVPAPVEGIGQIVLDVGVDGAWTWHVGSDADEAGTTRGGGTRRYVLPGDTGKPPVVESDRAAPNRGLIGQLGKRVIKVLLFRVLEEAGAWAGEKIARRWEDAHRPHRLRWVTAADIGDPLAQVPTVTTDQLRALGSERALLLVHGTASRTDSCFRSMPANVVHALADRYGGRVLAFDHPTVSYDPDANVRWFAQQFPDDIAPTFDVISHSRGGLVTRLLFERTDMGIDSHSFDRAVLVASPNNGTVLASPDKLNSLLDALTNVVGAAPANPIGDVLEVVLTAVQHLAVGALRGLDGLHAMDPQQEWLKANLPDPSRALARYRALGSDYGAPNGGSLARIARDLATDALFSRFGNDLVVPTDGTDLGGMITRSLRFARDDSVDHSGYWATARATDQIKAWLGV